jgi:hypothetical protein
MLPPHPEINMGDPLTAMSKKALTFFGLALIIAGALALAYKGISYTKRENVIDVGPIKATVDTRETLPIPLWLGGLMLGGGVCLLVAGVRKPE